MTHPSRPVELVALLFRVQERVRPVAAFRGCYFARVKCCRIRETRRTGHPASFTALVEGLQNVQVKGVLNRLCPNRARSEWNLESGDASAIQTRYPRGYSLDFAVAPGCHSLYLEEGARSTRRSRSPWPALARSVSITAGTAWTRACFAARL